MKVVQILIFLGLTLSSDRLLARASGWLSDGHGRFHNAAHKKIYQGEWKNGQRQGFGETIFEDPRDERYSIRGEWKNGMPDGEATMLLKNGHSYSGKFVKGWMTGDFVHASPRGQRTIEVFAKNVLVSTLASFESSTFAREKGLHGLRLNHIETGSRLYKLGYRSGDLIMTIGQHNIDKTLSDESINEWIPSIFRGQKTSLIREGQELFIRDQALRLVENAGSSNRRSL